jgi:hypothetical protein
MQVHMIRLTFSCIKPMSQHPLWLRAAQDHFLRERTHKKSADSDEANQYILCWNHARCGTGKVPRA